MDNDDGGRKAEDAEAEDVEEGLNGGWKDRSNWTPLCRSTSRSTSRSALVSDDEDVVDLSLELKEFWPWLSLCIWLFGTEKECKDEDNDEDKEEFPGVLKLKASVASFRGKVKGGMIDAILLDVYSLVLLGSSLSPYDDDDNALL
jgi:hypothetical protein